MGRDVHVGTFLLSGYNIIIVNYILIYIFI